MAEITIIPKRCVLAEQLLVEDESNMYTSVDSDTCGHVYYNSAYGNAVFQTFNFELEFDPITLPERAVINGVRIAVKGKQDKLYQPHPKAYADNKEIAWPSHNYFTGDVLTLYSGISDKRNFPYIIGADRFYIRIPFQLYSSPNSGDLYIYGAEATIYYFVPDAYIKEDGTWKPVRYAYKKVNGQWQTIEVSSAFESDKHYEKG